MKIIRIAVHNFRSIIDVDIAAHDYMLLVGPNNAGKSTVLGALRAFYDDVKWTPEDFPKTGASDDESWVQLTFQLNDEEWASLADRYKVGVADKTLTVRRYFKSADKSRVAKGQSNIFGVVGGTVEADLFYGAKNVGGAKLGSVLYVPALTTAAEQTKMTGPSPLRNMLNFLLKKVVSKSKSYQAVQAAFEKLNEEARGESGFLSEISSPLNSAIASWGVKMDLSVGAFAPEEISKSLVSFAFIDQALGDSGFPLERYGHGFQRSVIYELLRLAPSFRDEKTSTKKEFDPSFNLVLFEEPEAFLHPSQQENMAYHLRRLGAEDGQQVIITTHSPTFAGKAAEEIGQLVRVQRSEGVTQTHQPKDGQTRQLFEQGGELLTALQAFSNDGAVPDNKRARARRMIANPPEADIAVQEERFRFQLWLDGERSSLFFADRVLLVEGASERALFNYLLAGDWNDLAAQRICVIDVLGKFNFHRYMALLSVYGIPHGVVLDDDNDSAHAELHGAVNDLVENSANAHTLATPVKFNGCLESFLGLPVPDRPDQKPIEIMKAVTAGNIAEQKLRELRGEFCRALAIDDQEVAVQRNSGVNRASQESLTTA